jgi:hypothetical protein
MISWGAISSSTKHVPLVKVAAGDRAEAGVADMAEVAGDRAAVVDDREVAAGAAVAGTAATVAETAAVAAGAGSSLPQSRSETKQGRPPWRFPLFYFSLISFSCGAIRRATHSFRQAPSAHLGSHRYTTQSWQKFGPGSFK